MKQQLTELFSAVLDQMGINGVQVLVSRPENVVHGEYTTNVAMLAAAQKKVKPIEIAQEIKQKIDTLLASFDGSDGYQNRYQTDQSVHDFQIKPEWKIALQAIEKIEIAGPGFLNVFFSEAKLSTLVQRLLFSENSATIRQKSSISGKSQKVMVEYAHPNTHKAFHIGHLRNITTGESIVRLLEAVGHTVIRANYQGDIGMHIAKAIWGIQHIHDGLARLDAIKTKPLSEKIAFLGETYAYGATKYEENDSVKEEVAGINKQIYAKDPAVYPLYQETRKWSLDYFDAIYKRVDTHFDRLYFESEVYESGKQLVEDGVKKGIFIADDGAVIFPGKKFGLHNRVFITRDGNPTYEGKDMGLGKVQFSEFHPDLVIHCVGSEQIGYFQVIIEALAQIMPETKGKEQHLVYGWVNLKEGKMSSRTGQVVLGEWLIDTVKEEIRSIIEQNISKGKDSNQTISYTSKETEDIAEACAIAAVKYGFLKVGTKQDIAFDIKESINLQGDSGPYLLYTYARCQSVLKKAGSLYQPLTAPDEQPQLNEEEKALLRLLLYYPEIVGESAENYAPSTLCTYLFQLAQAFNLFYAKHSILGENPVSGLTKGSNTEIETNGSFRLFLTAATAKAVQRGLSLLGIKTVERM